MIDEKELIKILVDYKSDKWNRELYTSLPSVVDDCIDFVESQSKIGEWIPCSERLPEEPEEIPTEEEFIEAMILDGKFKEYIVMIYGGNGATTLYYIGNDNWCDGINNECYYRVLAWQPLPEPYMKVEKASSDSE